MMNDTQLAAVIRKVNEGSRLSGNTPTDRSIYWVDRARHMYHLLVRADADFDAEKDGETEPVAFLVDGTYIALLNCELCDFMQMTRAFD